MLNFLVAFIDSSERYLKSELEQNVTLGNIVAGMLNGNIPNSSILYERGLAGNEELTLAPVLVLHAGVQRPLDRDCVIFEVEEDQGVDVGRQRGQGVFLPVVADDVRETDVVEQYARYGLDLAVQGICAERF